MVVIAESETKADFVPFLLFMKKKKTKWIASKENVTRLQRRGPQAGPFYDSMIPVVLNWRGPSSKD